MKKTDKLDVDMSNVINQLFEGDCLEYMNKIPDESVDMILCDLPYGITQNEWDCYIPLDELWKQYNRVIKPNGAIVLTANGVFTAKLILKHIHDIPEGDSFVGHIGGDDFVAIIDKYDYPKLCKNIISEFDNLVPNYYTEDDVERGYVEVANRRGIIEQFPLVSISIGVVKVTGEKNISPLEIGEISAQVKHKAKEILGSTYVINHRKF